MKKAKRKDEKKGNKSFTIYSIILVFLILVLIISITYAYFTRPTIINGNDPETNVTTGLLDVDFLTTEYINNTDAVLIDDDVAYNTADKTVFSVSRSANNTARNVYYTIALKDIVISNNLKNSLDFKWALYNRVGLTSSTTPIASGDFRNVSNGTLSIHSEKIALPQDAVHNYSLLIWLSNDPNTDQADLLNGHFEGRIEVTATNG